MSIKTMTHVWEHSTQKGASLLLLLAIADYANDDARAWPSISTLAAKIRMSERNTQRIVQRLAVAGEIAIEAGKGQNGANVYRVTTPFRSPDRGDKMSPGGDIALSPGGCHSYVTGGGDIAMSPDPPFEPSYDPSKKIAATPPPPTTPALAPESVRECFFPEPQTAAPPPPAWYEAEPAPAPPVVVENIPTTKTIADTPVVALYRDTFLRFPPKAQMVWLLQQDVTDLRRWRDVLDLWLGKGWAPTNLNGMVDLYRNPNRINELRNFSQERTNANVSANRNTAPGTRSVLAKGQVNAAGNSHLIPGGASNQRPTATLMPFDENGTDGWL